MFGTSRPPDDKRDDRHRSSSSYRSLIACGKYVRRMGFQVAARRSPCGGERWFAANHAGNAAPMSTRVRLRRTTGSYAIPVRPRDAHDAIEHLREVSDCPAQHAHSAVAPTVATALAEDNHWQSEGGAIDRVPRRPPTRYWREGIPRRPDRKSRQLRAKRAFAPAVGCNKPARYTARTASS